MTVRILTHLESETLTLPELQRFVGRDVEIVIRDRDDSYRDAKSPATEADWDAFFAKYGTDLVDPEVYREYRQFDAEHLGEHWDGAR
jgi:hypothetical protein